MNDAQRTAQRELSYFADWPRTFVDTRKWTIRDDGTLNIPREDIAMTPDAIAVEYQRWAKPGMADKATQGVTKTLKDGFESGSRTFLSVFVDASLYAMGLRRLRVPVVTR
ncbi:hypothetical protein TWF106_002112 [Orbilia oligospora]|uniref:Uncharacterized protein n=1 Tax=Orbilia oligospora TaxID=2813651 RepID=A0A6G1M286_ORBOL|nr:hypothetical protein TWF679_010678 [Orbilia oligospora]KAF3225594.1 hypothetical protein TWF106_002112 [Orbilia oligospora]KAF3226192.1 hypothetical protein TWF191_004854 [Orbilia oligospora]KAF3241798.1 hypothetical protein TWF192_008812 [Orbilia oligospora]